MATASVATRTDADRGNPRNGPSPPKYWSGAELRQQLLVAVGEHANHVDLTRLHHVDQLGVITLRP